MTGVVQDGSTAPDLPSAAGGTAAGDSAAASTAARDTVADDTAAAGDALLNEMQRTVLRYAALVALVGVGCPEELRDGPLTVAELAERCGAHAPTLARLLRATAPTGLLRLAGPGLYALTEAGQALLDGAELMRLRFSADPEIWISMGELTETVRTGQAPFMQRHGSTYDYLSSRPEASAAFDKLMVGNHVKIAPRLAQNGAVPSTGTVVDVGGGQGTFLAAILRARPGLRGVLLDLERTVDGAREYLKANGVGDRCEVVAGDFFTAVPPGADAYLLAAVLHNWGDGKATEILGTVRSAIPAHGRLLLVGAVLPDDDRPHPGKDLDIRMLTRHDGKERTYGEFSALLADSGFLAGPVTDLGPGTSLLTATPA
jgi:hypothetical protein